MGTTRYKLREDSIIVHDDTIRFHYYLSRRRRTLGLSVKADGSIIVRSPAGVSLRAIRDFVARQAQWIARARQQIAGRVQRPEQRFEEGTEHLYLGERYRLVVRQGEQNRVDLGDDAVLVVTIRATVSADDHVRATLSRWYLRQAEAVFQQRLAACQKLVEPAGIPLPAGLVIRPMRSRWGSYSYRTRRICLNLHLIRAPLHCLDYVIIHELCHARARHHGPDFWRLVERFVPDHLRIRKELTAFTG
ncbi:M48 family metallopeptidase [Geobacter sp. SVR]|uniref:M48 family metallopeptidase n=1 Tax=Geobacter sp. SVR TaxID=2495594 RepID=UPI00143EF645|nr:SprT family zinc-dependent metalloprotease [Geobacter sp. SVR]BCS53350.1 hydrolase [Geobacter sp. SVR]GCF85524.1 hydrolase [Geobacter sp. SVR]